MNIQAAHSQAVQNDSKKHSKKAASRKHQASSFKLQASSFKQQAFDMKEIIGYKILNKGEI